jgi:hypothetical protein
MLRRFAILALGLGAACGGIAVVDPPASSGEGGSGASSGDGGSGAATDVTVVGTSTASGSTVCSVAIDRECYACASVSCEDVLATCCDTQGCVALIECVSMFCEQPDPGCVITFCGSELMDAGGPGGPGTEAARNFADCAQKACDACG